MEEQRLQELIRERAPWFTGAVRNIVWRNVVRFERRLADSFGHGRLWLAGDSAHLTSPVGIQSMNVGLQEGYRLAGALARVLRGGSGQEAWRNMAGSAPCVAQIARDGGGGMPAAEADAWTAARASRFLTSLPRTARR